jgi:hypothetical protein
VKWAVLLLACTGCDALLGLGETEYAPDATACTPGQCMTFASCSALRAQFSSAPSGVYTLDAGTGEFQAYCEHAADGGGWTLAMKVDGRTTTFGYDQPIWTNETLHAPDAAALDHTQAKLATFNAIAFTEVRVGLEYPIDSGTVRWLVAPIAGARLRDAFAGATAATTLGRAAWKGLAGDTSSLQLNCNAEGINVGNASSRVRIGIVSNNQADCSSPDSWIGIGGADNAQCTIAGDSTAGNTACLQPDNGDVGLAAFGYLMVR